MSLAVMPWWLFAAGIPLLAAGLYLLQRLRSERRFVAFAAASLWARMPRATPHRVLGGRFRYWLAYLLSLAILLLLWLAVADPVGAPPEASAARVFYLDTSAVLTDGKLAGARRALIADVRATPAERRMVVLGDAMATPLLAPGESVSLLSARLDGVDADARPSNFDGWLRDRAARQPSGQPLTVRYYGGWGAARGTGAALPRNVRLDFGYLTPPVPDNRGIVALGVTPAASGQWRKADVLVTVASPGARAAVPGDVAVTLDGRAVTPSIVPLGGGRFVLPGIDADGSTLTVALRRGDGFTADDSASLRLPARAPIKVGFTQGVPAAIRQVAALDDAIAVTDLADATVVVRRAGEQTGDDRPALELSTPGQRASAFVFAEPQDRARGDLSGRLAEFGLDQIDAAALADRLRRPVGIELEAAPVRSIAVWSALFDPAGSFARSAAMPLFVSQALRWLADEPDWTPYAKAGAPLPDPTALTGWSGTPVESPGALGGRIQLGGAGTARVGDRDIAVALTDRATTDAVRLQPGDGVAASPRATGLVPPNAIFVAIGLAALLLLGLEWVAYRRGWMP